MISRRLILQGAVFQIGWMLAVLGGDLWALVAVGAMSACHWMWFSRDLKEWLLIFIVAVLGYCIDWSLFSVRILHNANDLTYPPLWLGCIWVMFSMTLCHLFSWLHQRMGWAIVLGMVFGPLSYFSGAALSAVQIMEPLWFGLLALALVWMLVFPTAIHFASRVHA